jgi:APA family basic amino acid/polyamine antiporter
LFFSVFGELHPKYKVPVKGGWIICFFICLVSFFLDLEAITKIISVGNLMTYTVVNMAVIALRFRDTDN